jgi:transglutaminase-like putative cysteine protease
MNAAPILRSLIASLAIVMPVSAAPPSALTLSGYVTYAVRMKTTVRVPGSVTDSVKVWHALPTPRPWSMTGSELGAISPAAQPDGGRFVFQKDKNSYHFLWQFDGLFEPGKEIEAATHFYVNSCNRRFTPSKSKTQWSDLPAATRVDQSDPQVDFVKRLRQRSSTPALFVSQASSWIDQTITYDASVPHPSDNVMETLRAKRGHCGHYYEVLRALCDAAGVPIRRVFGLNLYADNISSEPLYKVRADYVNIHTWAEVQLPADGWIEVEPSQGKNAFAIPARFVQNNPWFQNYSVWVQENGEWRQPQWTRREGGWDSDYGVEHAITYEKIPLGTGDPKQFPRLWSSRNGRFKIVATMVDFDEESVTLATAEGRRIEVKWSELAEAEREVVSTTP